MRSSSRATRSPVSEVSTTKPKHSRVSVSRRNGLSAQKWGRLAGAGQFPCRCPAGRRYNPAQLKTGPRPASGSCRGRRSRRPEPELANSLDPLWTRFAGAIDGFFRSTRTSECELERHDNDTQVEPQRSVADIPLVQLIFFLRRQHLGAIHLSPAGNARTHSESSGRV